MNADFVWTVSGVIDTVVLVIVALIGCLLVSVYVMTWIVVKVQVLMCKLGLHKHAMAEHKCRHHMIFVHEPNGMCSACIPPRLECERCGKPKHKVKQ